MTQRDADNMSIVSECINALGIGCLIEYDIESWSTVRDFVCGIRALLDDRVPPYFPSPNTQTSALFPGENEEDALARVGFLRRALRAVLAAITETEAIEMATDIFTVASARCGRDRNVEEMIKILKQTEPGMSNSADNFGGLTDYEMSTRAIRIVYGDEADVLEAAVRADKHAPRPVRTASDLTRSVVHPDSPVTGLFLRHFGPYVGLTFVLMHKRDALTNRVVTRCEGRVNSAGKYEDKFVFLTRETDRRALRPLEVGGSYVILASKSLTEAVLMELFNAPPLWSPLGQTIKNFEDINNTNTCEMNLPDAELSTRLTSAQNSILRS